MSQISRTRTVEGASKRLLEDAKEEDIPETDVKNIINGSNVPNEIESLGYQ
jgi:hypothetical protein